MIKPGFKLLEFEELKAIEQIQKSELFYESLNKRRSVREFSSKELPNELIENIVKTASTAPSGAHKQPWVFCVVKSKQIKRDIRIAAEKEEYENYHGRMSDEWLSDLKKFDTNWEKPFLEKAPVLIIVFKKTFDVENGDKKKNYYVNESVGIATGMLLAAIHNAGLVALTHTPSPLNFLAKLLKRPENEKPYLLIPVGYPEKNTQIPCLKRKELSEILYYY
ncbi:MAG: nitroreductase family protein [Bacteroidetes bacterium]|nr:MAG: nitroreductase family protein [Bacteroidota bacterium]MBL1143802.1 nitroreductase family protein [Bacteroidota bacterium]NOG56603.1 nitroreductase family protein [Bacteroidota bacterium]